MSWIDRLARRIRRRAEALEALEAEQARRARQELEMARAGQLAAVQLARREARQRARDRANGLLWVRKPAP
ncbi:MAG: hypothetical protein ABSA65_11735 [Acidimicrobiales bacterium]|jgi:hypothetical protein